MVVFCLMFPCRSCSFRFSGRLSGVGRPASSSIAAFAAGPPRPLWLRPAGGTLVCCGQPMKIENENTQDAALEKHVPVLEKTAEGYKVTVGSIPHPMEEKHYIERIELIVGDQVHRRHLAPGEAPEAFFPVRGEGAVAREFCNLHGLWRK